MKLGRQKNKQQTANRGFKKLAVLWLNEHLSFVSIAMLADSFVFRNRQLHKPANRYRQANSRN